jgi:hypothetical protein
LQTAPRRAKAAQTPYPERRLAMPLVAFSVRLDRIEEPLLYHNGSWWLSGVCTFDEDYKGRMIVAQSISKERYAAGEKGPAIGTWREIGGGSKPTAGGPKDGFDLAKFKAAATQPRPPAEAKYPDGQEEGVFPSSQGAEGAAKEAQRELREGSPHGFELGF